MSAPKFTPGPWHLIAFIRERDGYAPGGIRKRIVSNNSEVADEYVVSSANASVATSVCKVADARLIAAAPSLYEALRDLIAWEQEQGGWEAPAWDRARAALAKAVLNV